MHTKYRNVNQAFYGLVEGIHSGSIKTHAVASRVGECLMVEEPVIVTYDQPRERVLLNPNRDANPFFHLYESLWMLAGRNTVAELDYYASDYSKITSDDGRTANGAYGYRWRSVTGPVTSRKVGPDGVTRLFRDGLDQLKIIVDQLKRKPDSRRVVLSMWNVEDDLLKIDTTKDVCCNTHAYFLVERGPCRTCEARNKLLFFVAPGPCPACGGPYGSVGHEQPRYLNMTVCNRSNDLIWGMLGANVVHFSILQEYLAAWIGLEVGTYHQITNNLHAYTERWHPELWLGEYRPKMLCPDCQKQLDRSYVGQGFCDGCGQHSYSLGQLTWKDQYEDLLKPYPVVKDPETFDKEVVEFVERHSKDSSAGPYDEPFLWEVAQPMCVAFHQHKRRNYADALVSIESVKANDWRVAGKMWLEKRKRNWEKRYGQAKRYGASDQVLAEDHPDS